MDPEIEKHLRDRGLTGNTKRKRRLRMKKRLERKKKSKTDENVPVTRDNVPVTRDNVPVTRDNEPSKRDNTPQTRDNAPATRDNAPATRDNASLTRSNLLSRDSEDSFSDDGELERTHSGTLAALEDTRSPPPKQRVVPIFPFRTYCKPHQFPVSTVPFLDSHCHIDYLFVREQNYGSFASYVASKDFPKNFSGCVANFCDPPAWGENQMYEDILEEDGVWAAFGLHPHNAKHWCDEVESDLVKAASHPKCVAWGEMGLDYGKGSTVEVIEAQKEAFMAQIRHALRLGKPFVIHGRGAEMDTFEIMKAKVPKEHRIHFHCYSGSWNTARKMLEYFTNMYLGVTGLVTFSSASDVHEVARKLPLDRLLIETDAPYMKPSNAKHVDQDSPRSSSPAMCLWVAAKIAEIRRVELDDVLKQVRLNVKDMYGI